MSDDVSRLLARGGRVLGLASLAYARGQRAGQGPWYALPEEMVAATEEILAALDQGPDARALTAAVGSAMGPEPATAAPAWASPLWESPERLPTVGRGVESEDLTVALPGAQDAGSLDDRTRGLAAVAVAFCRSVDVVENICRSLDGDDAARLRRMSRLANALVEAGQPTRMRRAIRRLLDGEG